MQEEKLSEFLADRVGDPHGLLGMHPQESKDSLVVRVYRPGVERLELFDPASSRTFPLSRIDERGFFELEIKERSEVFPYFLRSYGGPEGDKEFRDPYAFLPTIGNDELSDFNQGLELRPHEKLGAIFRTFEGVNGVAFVVWAPFAEQVFLTGDFNGWKENSLPMRPLGPSGCWELFVPYASCGDKYKFLIHDQDGKKFEKADPFAAFGEHEDSSDNASIIHDPSLLPEAETLRKESSNPLLEPISVYEAHLGSWRGCPREGRPLTYLELAEQLPEYVCDLGFTHIEFLPPAEHPYTVSWGYQVNGYYAPTSRYGRPEEFAQLVNACHRAGLGVILDWVPGHFPADDFGLARFDGSCLFEHEESLRGLNPEWGTLIFNYARPEVRSFLFGSAFSWIDRFGVDGFRVDAVAAMLYLDYGKTDDRDWIPNKGCPPEQLNWNFEAIDFLRSFHESLSSEYPEVISIAEESTAFPGVTKPVSEDGLGFHFKWNMGWMHDVLSYLSAPQLDRPANHGNLTFGATYQFAENFVQAFSHDEVVHEKGSLVNKMNASGKAGQLSQLRALYALQWAWPGKKTLFMGGELAQWKEWDFDSELDWALLDSPAHAGIRDLIRDLNQLYRNRSGWAAGDCRLDKFKWVSADDAEGRSISFLRFGEEIEETMLALCNFSDHGREFTVGCPHPGNWKVLLDTSWAKYGGSEKEVLGNLKSEPLESDGFPQSLRPEVRALSVVLLGFVSA